jgi:hypothetical protein
VTEAKPEPLLACLAQLEAERGEDICRAGVCGANWVERQKTAVRTAFRGTPKDKKKERN